LGMTRPTRNRRDTVRVIEIGQRHNTVLGFCRGSDLDLSTPSKACSHESANTHSSPSRPVKPARALAAVRAVGSGAGTGHRNHRWSALGRDPQYVPPVDVMMSSGLMVRLRVRRSGDRLSDG
jgi:hypothetical protein